MHNLARHLKKVALVLLILSFCAIFFILKENFFSSSQAYLVAQKLSLKLEDCDVILRKGLGVESALIAKVSNSRFSHIGIVVKEHNKFFVIHATTADESNTSGFGAVIKVPLEKFLLYAEDLAVKRYFLSEKDKSLVKESLEQKLGSQFSLEDRKESLYCTTLLLQSLLPYTAHQGIRYQYVDLPVFRGFYLFPEVFFQDPKAKLIVEDLKSLD